MGAVAQHANSGRTRIKVLNTAMVISGASVLQSPQALAVKKHHQANGADNTNAISAKSARTASTGIPTTTPADSEAGSQAIAMPRQKNDYQPPVARNGR